ncbi:MAG: YdeI family protein [Vicinamibacterales bacterium]
MTAPARGAVRTFRSAAAWAAWLAAHHDSSDGLWLRFHKKHTGRQTFRPAEALDEALCWGWIDGQARPHDETSWLVRYTPRRPRSVWSKRNRDHVARLEAAGRMQPSGLAQVAAAVADGRWDAAYDSPANAQVPADFLRALARHTGALAFFRTLNRANHFAVTYRLQTAKRPETRRRRLEQLVQLMRNRRRIH